MSKKFGVTIDDDIIERIVNLMERAQDSNEARENNKIENFNKHAEFIHEQLRIIEQKLDKMDIGSDPYNKMIETYKRVFDIIKYY